MSQFLSLLSKKSLKSQRMSKLLITRCFSSISDEFLHRVADESMISPEILKELNKGMKHNKKNLLETSSISDLPQLEETVQAEPIISTSEDSIESAQFYNRLRAMGIKTPSYLKAGEDDESSLLQGAVEAMFGKPPAKDCLSCSLSSKPIYPSLPWNFRLGTDSWLQEFLGGLLQDLSPMEINRKTPKWISSGDRGSAAAYEFRPIGYELEEIPASVTVKKKLQAVIAEPRKYPVSVLPGYAHFLFRGRFSSLCKVLEETKVITLKDNLLDKKKNGNGLRVLDLGMGPGLGLSAVHKIFGRNGTEGCQLASYTGFSTQPAFREQTERLSVLLSEQDEGSVRNLPYSVSIHSKMQEILNNSMDNVNNKFQKDENNENKKKRINKTNVNNTGNGRYDLILLPYLFTDLGNDDEVRFRYLQLAYELLDDGGHVVIVDEGGPFGSYMTRWAREVLLKLNISCGNSYSVHLKSLLPGGFAMENVDLHSDLKGNFLLPPLGASSIDDYKRSSEELQVVAPCTHDEVCPKSLGDWCSFSHKFPSGKQNYQSEEKFSYVTLMKYDKRNSTPSWFASPTPEPNVSSILTQLNSFNNLKAKKNKNTNVYKFEHSSSTHTQNIEEILLSEEIQLKDPCRDNYIRVFRSPKIDDESKITLEGCSNPTIVRYNFPNLLDSKKPKIALGALKNSLERVQSGSLVPKLV